MSGESRYTNNWISVLSMTYCLMVDEQKRCFNVRFLIIFNIEPILRRKGVIENLEFR